MFRRHRVLTALGIAVAVVALAVGVFAFLWSRSGAHPVSVDEARQRFSAHDPAGQGSGRFTPADGVYSYTGTGTESLSSPPKSQSEGPGIPGTVTHSGNGCWVFRLDYSSNHWREWTYCSSPNELTEKINRVYQRWDFVVTTVDNLATMTCDPPAEIMSTTMEPGDRWRSNCSGTNTDVDGTTVSTGTRRFVGTEPVEVGHTKVDALHFREDRVVSGAQTGTEVFDQWLTADGLPVKGEQRITVDSDSPIGRVTYSQQGSFTLTSLTPRR